MQPRIAVIIVGLALVSVVRSDNYLKCYMCISTTNPHCAKDPKAYGIHPVECTLKHMSEWQETLQHKNVSKVIWKIFDVDHSTDFQHAAPVACMKMVMKVDKKEVTLRTCQTPKTDTIDPCKSIRGKLNNSISLEHCDLCTHDACNTSPGLSPGIFVTLLSFVGAVILGGFYNGA